MRILALILILLITFPSHLHYTEFYYLQNIQDEFSETEIQNSTEQKDTFSNFPYSHMYSHINDTKPIATKNIPTKPRTGYNNSASWWNPDWHFRIKVDVYSPDFERYDFPVDLTINFSAFLSSLGVTEQIDLNSIRVVEYVRNMEDETLSPVGLKNSNAVFINSTYSIVKISFIMNGTSAKNEYRTFYIYFDTVLFPKPAVVIENKRFMHGNKKTLVYGVGTLNDWLGDEEDFGIGSIGLNGWLQIAVENGIISSYTWANHPSYFGLVSYNQSLVENLSSSDYGIFIYDISQNSDSMNDSYFYILTDKARESICKFISEGGKVIIGAHPNAQSEDVLDNNPSLKKYFPFKTQAWNDTRYHASLTEKAPRIPYFISDYELTNYVSYGMRHRGFAAKVELVDGAGEIWALDEYGNNVTASLGYNVFNCELFGCQVEHPDTNAYALFLLNMLSNRNISSPTLTNIGNIEYVNGIFLRINSSGNFLNLLELETDPLDKININLTTFYRGALPTTALLECISNEGGCALSFTSQTFTFPSEGLEERTLTITLPSDTEDGEIFYINFTARILGDMNESKVSIIIKSKYQISCSLKVIGNLDYFPGEHALFYAVITNTGRHPSIFFFKVSGDWNVSTEAEWAYLEPNNSTAFIITADIPPDALFGTYSEVEIVSWAYPRTDANDTLKCILKVKKVSNLFLDCIPDSIYIEPGRCVKFELVVRNDGNSPENIHLFSNANVNKQNESNQNESGWIVTLQTTEVLLEPKESIILNATLCAPLNALFGEVCMVSVEALADNDSESDFLMAIASELYSLELLALPNMQSAKPGDFSEFYIHVRNKGNCPAQFILNSSSQACFDNGKNVIQTGTIFPNETEIFKLLFEVPANALSGSQYDIYISASGKNLTSSIKVVVRVEHKHNITYSVNSPIILFPGKETQQNISITNSGNANEQIVIIIESTPFLGATINGSFEYSTIVYAFSNLTLNSTFYATKYTKHGNYKINITFIDHEGSSTLQVPVYIAQRYEIDVEFRNDSQKIKDGEIACFELFVKNIGNGLDDISLSCVCQNASSIFEKDILKIEAGGLAIVKLFVKPKSRCKNVTIECICNSIGDSDVDYANLQIQPRIQKVEENTCCLSLIILLSLLAAFILLLRKREHKI